jgi:TPR repeat protein
MKWYRRAADGGSADAMENIGALYEKGLGVAADPVEAHKWYDKAKSARGQ